MGIFHSLLNPEFSHSVSCIDCPKSLSLRALTSQGSRETVEGLSPQPVTLTLGCGVKSPCHFFGKSPDDPGYIMFLFDVDCNLGIKSLLLGFTQRSWEKSYKAIFCLFYIPEDPLAGFSTLPSLYLFFFRVSLKIMAVMKQLSFTTNLLCARTCAGCWIYVISCNFNKYRR